jgi:hypothetical protein
MFHLNPGKGEILLFIGWVACRKIENGIFLTEDEIFGATNNPSLFPS